MAGFSAIKKYYDLKEECFPYYAGGRLLFITYVEKFMLKLSSLQEACDGHQKDQAKNNCVVKTEGACSHRKNFTFGWGAYPRLFAN